MPYFTLATYLSSLLQLVREHVFQSRKPVAQIPDLGFQIFNIGPGLPHTTVKVLHPSLHFLIHAVGKVRKDFRDTLIETYALGF